jgi:tetratricopeptide (TPR) repeat protein
MSSKSPLIAFAAMIALGLASPTNAYARGGGGGHGGGFHGGSFHTGGYGGYRGGGGYGGYRGGYSAPSFNRTPSFSTPHAQYGNAARPNTINNFNRPNTFNNANRFNNVNNINRFNNVTNINRFNNVNVANRAGWGWHNPYLGYHQGWVHGYWNGHYPGYWGGYPGYWGGGFGWGLGSGLGWGLGMGLGYGLTPWMFGPMLYNWGYSNYSNPYYGGYAGNTVVAQQPAVYDYSQPLDTQSEPPPENVTTQANTTFDSAREAFKGGDYSRALDLVEQSLRQTPNDPTLHEFRALVLFALKRYDEAAAAIYSVLSVGPGWDWTTLISLYADPETYTQQLRALENYCVQNTQAPQARFVLAYHYMTQGHADAAIRQLKNTVAIQPKDQLSAQLLQQLEQAQAQQAAGTETPQAPPVAPPAETATNPTSPVKEGKLEGTWVAQPVADTTITLTLQDQGRFAWKVSKQGKDQQFGGKFIYENGILTLVQDQNNNNVMVGNVSWKDDGRFNFKVLGGGPADPGLTFAHSK